MQIEKFSTPGMGENIYLVWETSTKEAVMIDPGAPMMRLDNLIEEQGIKPIAILLTHGHGDHILGCEHYQKKYDIPIYCHRNEQEMLERAKYNHSKEIFGMEYTIEEAFYFDEGRLVLGSFEIEVIHTPGHTKGSSCFFIKDQLFSGDTLFKLGVGRYDLYGGDEGSLMHSVKHKLFKLPEAVVVHPGHGVKTSIGYEKTHNPFIR